MSNGNKHQSEWSSEFHRGRGDVTLPCPAESFGGHDGLCAQVHPVGITLTPAGGWKATPVGDGWNPGVVEHYV